MKFWHAVACLLLALCAGEVCYASDLFSQHDNNNKNINKESPGNQSNFKNDEILQNTQTLTGNNLNFWNNGDSNPAGNPRNTMSMMPSGIASKLGKGQFGGQIRAFWLQMDQLTRKCSELQEIVAKLTVSNEHLEKELQVETEHAKEQKEEIKVLNEKIEELRSRNEQNLQKIAENNTVIGGKKQLEEDFFELKENIQKKDEEIVGLNDTIKDLKKQVNDQEKDSIKYKIELDNANNIKDELEEKNKTLEEKIRVLQEKAQTLKEQKQQSDLELEKRKGECNVANEKLGKSGEEKEVLRKENKDLKSAKEVVEVKLEKLETEFGQLKEISQKESSELSIKLKDNEFKIYDLEKELEAYKQLKMEYTRLNEENQKLLEENESFRADFIEWNAMASSVFGQDPNLGTVPPDYNNVFNYSVKIPKEYPLNPIQVSEPDDLMQDEQEVQQNDGDTSGAEAQDQKPTTPRSDQRADHSEDHPSSNENTSQSPSNAEDKTQKNES